MPHHELRSTDVVIIYDSGDLPLTSLPVLQRAGGVDYSPEVPVAARWVITDLPQGGADAATVLVSTSEQSAAVRARLAAGGRIVARPQAPVTLPEPARSLGEAAALMARALRQGEWEQSQTHESLIPYLREETEELVEAITAGQRQEELRDELSDVLLQVLFHAEIASREGRFTIADVAQAFIAKLRARAPYLFTAEETFMTTAEQDRLWQEGKRRAQRSYREI